MEEKITAALIIEALGRPPEHLKNVLSDIISKLRQEKDVIVISDKIAEPKKLEGQENLFSSFIEIELSTHIEKLIILIFLYMPSHIEIITPERVVLSNTDISHLLSELARRLHQYDEIAKRFLIEKHILQKRIEAGEIIIKDSKKKLKKKSRRKLKKRKGS